MSSQFCNLALASYTDQENKRATLSLAGDQAMRTQLRRLSLDGGGGLRRGRARHPHDHAEFQVWPTGRSRAIIVLPEANCSPGAAPTVVPISSSITRLAAQAIMSRRKTVPELFTNRSQSQSLSRSWWAP